MPTISTDRKWLLGMVHVGALPGAPKSRAGIEELVRRSVEEAKLLIDAGFDGVIVENMHDAPYLHADHGPEVVACMTRIGHAVREATRGKPLGVQVLSGGAKEAVGIALAIGADFVRVENFVFAHVADEGLLAKAEAGPLLRYRRSIGAEKIAVYADIKKKHASHAITADVSIADAVEAAEFFGADGVIVTGTATGKAVNASDLESARTATKLPLLVGSGVTPEQAPKLLRHADALIVGSWIKRDGVWSNPVDPDRAAEMSSAMKKSRGAKARM